jgi:hypothetical protein
LSSWEQKSIFKSKIIKIERKRCWDRKPWSRVKIFKMVKRTMTRRRGSKESNKIKPRPKTTPSQKMNELNLT